MNIMLWVPDWDGVIPQPAIIKPTPRWTGKQMISMVLPPALNLERLDAKGEDATRVVLQLHPRLAPVKVAVLPLVKKDGLPEVARDLVKTFFNAGINAQYDEQHAIGKRYRRHDEIGTPYCLTVDGQSKEDGTVTIRDRDTMKQERVPMAEALSIVQRRLAVV